MRTRFAPEPSGYIHIGHMKSIVYNTLFAKKNDGTFILRMDDSNPITCNNHYVVSIIKDLALCGIGYEWISYMSDLFDDTEKYVEVLINKDKAYVDDSDADAIKKSREDRCDTPSRSNTVEQNIELWEKMKKGECPYVVRLKIDMKSNNGALRDPIIYKVLLSDNVHYRAGKRYVYPLFDFISPIADNHDKVTHVLRTGEFTDKIPLHKWILKELGMKEPVYKSFSRFNLNNTILSKRNLRRIIDNTELTWDHPMIPTIRGMHNRGITLEAFMSYFEFNMSFKTSISYDEWDKILKKNRDIIDKRCKKLFAVGEYNTYKINDNKDDEVKIPYNVRNKDLGDRIIKYPSNVMIDKKDVACITDGDTIRLLHLDVFKVSDRLTPSNDRPIYNASWLTNGIECELLICNKLLKVHHKGDEDILSILSDPLFETRRILVENDINNMRSGDILQLYRMGYVKIMSMNPIKLVLIDEPGNNRQFLLR